MKSRGPNTLKCRGAVGIRAPPSSGSWPAGALSTNKAPRHSAELGCIHSSPGRAAGDSPLRLEGGGAWPGLGAS